MASSTTEPRILSRSGHSVSNQEVHYSGKDFIIKDDEITPTMEVKRNVVTERYRDTLEEMHQ